MKTKITLFLLAVLFTLNIFSQQKNLAEVYVVNGVEAYILNEPVRSYEIVYGKGGGLNFGSYLTGGLINPSVSSKVGKFIKGVVKKSEKEGKKIDAIIYTSGKNVTAIKFTDDPTPENRRKAKVHRLNGIPAYVMCDPINDFKVVATKGGGVKWKSAMTGGILNNSIEEDLSKFAKKFKKMYKKGQIDAIYYTSGKSCDGIKFKE
jgi:ribosomal protein L25 (general stress protein Ctc)